MSDNKNSKDEAFEILNREFANHELEKENARNLEAIKRRQAIQQAQKERQNDGLMEDDENTGGSGCAGNIIRILLILILAAVLAWIVFMPDGSIEELWNKVYPKMADLSSWTSGLFDRQEAAKVSVSDLTTTQFTEQTQTSDVNTTDSDVTTESSVTESTTTATTTAVVASTTTAAVTTTSAAANKDNSSNDTDTSSNSPYNITVYRPSQIVVVYDTAGNPVKVFTCSSGKAATPTRLGNYAIRAKYRWRFMIGNCYTQFASSFSSGYLFHSIPYDKKNPGTMFNASYDKLGNPASSGCIRLCCRDAKWIYDNCPIGTKVLVADEAAPAGMNPEIIPARIDDSAHSGWDPTDEDLSSPYNQ